MTETRIEVAGGKYGVILRDDGPSSGLRYGRNTGLPTNREYALACEIRDLRAEVASLRRARVTDAENLTLYERGLADARHQHSDLLEANNRYLNRARLAERALRLFREFVQRNATQWVLGAGHHHPIWKWIAGILDRAGQNDTACWGYEYQFVHAENTKTLDELESQS